MTPTEDEIDSATQRAHGEYLSTRPLMSALEFAWTQLPEDHRSLIRHYVGFGMTYKPPSVLGAAMSPHELRVRQLWRENQAAWQDSEWTMLVIDELQVECKARYDHPEETLKFKHFTRTPKGIECEGVLLRPNPREMAV